MQLIIWFTEVNNNIIYIDENIVKNYIYTIILRIN